MKKLELEPMNCEIVPVKNNMDMYYAYKLKMEKYKKAMDSACYFEAIHIDYAMLEDRLRSILYHIAFLNNRLDDKAWINMRDVFDRIAQNYNDNQRITNRDINQLAAKENVVRCVVSWVRDAKDEDCDTEFLKALKNSFKGLEDDFDDILNALNNLRVWRQKRNDTVHPLLTNNVGSVEYNLKVLATNGMRLANYFDALKNYISRGDAIRKSIGAPIE